MSENLQAKVIIYAVIVGIALAGLILDWWDKRSQRLAKKQEERELEEEAHQKRLQQCIKEEAEREAERRTQRAQQEVEDKRRIEEERLKAQFERMNTLKDIPVSEWNKPTHKRIKEIDDWDWKD